VTLNTRRRAHWKSHVPATLKDALYGCVEFAKEAHNLSVERIADLCGINSRDTLYKYIAEARLPIGLLIPFESACRINLVSRWKASAAGQLLLDIPKGKTASPDDINNLQSALTAAVGDLLAFYRDEKDEDAVLASVTAGLNQLAWHRANVAKYDQPELDL
jgi:hypothetical protein